MRLNYRIVPRNKQTFGRRGTHMSRRFGSSMDFSDFRLYEPGDDVRQIDWNVFARSEKLFIKRFLDEQEMRIHVLLDSSLSMADDEKWLHAKELAIAIGHIVLAKDDQLSCSSIQNGKGVSFRKKELPIALCSNGLSTNLKFLQWMIRFIPLCRSIFQKM